MRYIAHVGKLGLMRTAIDAPTDTAALRQAAEIGGVRKLRTEDGARVLFDDMDNPLSPNHPALAAAS